MKRFLTRKELKVKRKEMIYMVIASQSFYPFTISLLERRNP